MASRHNTSLEPINLTAQQQPSSVLDASSNSEFDQLLLTDFPLYPDSTSSVMSVPFDSNIDNEIFNIDALIDPTDDQPTFELPANLFANEELTDFLALYTDNEQPHQSTFTENFDSLSFQQSQQVFSPAASVDIGSSPAEPQVNDLDVQAYLNQQGHAYRVASKPKKTKNHRQPPTTVGPVEYYLNSSGCQPCTTQIQSDFVYQQQTLQYDAVETKKIQITCQPRAKFRPRTHNESKISSHYIRCEVDIKPEYPTISIPSSWAFQADVNLIEVALMRLDKEPHSYKIDNKASSNTFEDDALIFKQHESHLLYFRLTNEDYRNGYKTFMIELIKSKQDHVITKEKIRTHQLEHSMLRFTRLFQVGKGDFQRDEGSEEYSTIMSEAYGDVEVEHMGPRYGPMSGQEMVYMILKGRILKNDLKIQILESHTGWSYNVENFTKNGNVIYFLMPAAPYTQFETIQANIIVYYKGEELHQTSYLYKGSLDQELAALRLNDSCTTMSASSSTNSFDLFDYSLATGAFSISPSRKTSTPKRLQKKKY